MTEVGDGAELCFPELFNTSCRKPSLSWANLVFLRFLLSSVSVVTVALNLLVIISVSHYRQLHKPTNLLLLSLSVSDFSVGLVFFPGEILKKTACWFLGNFMCSLYKYIVSLAFTASVGNMVLISVDRYVAICYPLHYATKITLTRVRLCIFLCWLYSAVYGTLFVKDDQIQKGSFHTCYGECIYLTGYILNVTDLVLTFTVAVTVIVLLYLRVFVVAVSQARAMRSHVRALTLHNSVTSRKSELKAARTLGVLVVVFLICFCPFYCAALAGDVSFTTSVVVFFLLSFNSCLNPLIYALLYPWFRKAVKHIVTLQVLQPGSSEANIM